MNVLFLSEIFHPHGRGAELATYLFAKNLEAEGLNIVVVTNRFNGDEEVTKNGKLSIYRLPLFREDTNSKYSIFRRVDVLFSQFLRKLVKWADVVYIPRFWFSAIWLAKAYRKPVVVHFHDYIPICPLSTTFDITKNQVCSCKRGYCSLRCIYAYEKSVESTMLRTSSSVLLNSTLGRCLSRFTELSDAVICASNAQKNLIVSRRPRMSRKVSVIHNPLPEVKQLDIEGNGFAYFGGPYVLKGFHTLFRAVGYLKQSIHRETNVYVSDFAQVSAHFAERLRNRGFILRGRLSGSAYDDVYAKAGSVIVPSVCPEVSSYVAMEAMLRGRLLLASNVGGLPEIANGCSGAFTFPPGDSVQLAKIMGYVWSLSNDTVTDLGARNRESLTKRFDNKDSVSNFVRLLTRVSG